MKSLATCIWLIFTYVAVAQESPQPLTITDAGYFLTVVSSDGVPTFSRLVNVTDLRGEGPTDPNDPTEPDVDKDIALKVREWAASTSDPQGAQAVAIVYAHIRGAISDGTLPQAGIWVALKQATDNGLAVVNSQNAWVAFREKLTALMTDQQQRGQLQTSQQIVRLLLSVQRGVELSADGSEALGLDKLVEIARRTNEAIDDTL